MPYVSTSTSTSPAPATSAVPAAPTARAVPPATSLSRSQQPVLHRPRLRIFRAQNATMVFDNTDSKAPVSHTALDQASSTVIYHSTATQPLAPANAEAFTLAYGREPKNSDYDSHKMGMAGLGRYGKGHRPHVLMYGQAFEVGKKEKSVSYVDSSFQTKDGDARREAIKMAKTKAKLTAARFNGLVAEDGYMIKAESKKKKIVHSEQFPVRIPLDKNGNVLDGQDHTGRFLPNLTLEDIRREPAAGETPQARHDSVNCTPKTSPPPSASSPLANSKEHSKPPQPIPALAPSDRTDALGYSDMEPTCEDQYIYSKYIVKCEPILHLRQDAPKPLSRTQVVHENVATLHTSNHTSLPPRRVSDISGSRKRKSCNDVTSTAPQCPKRPKIDQKRIATNAKMDTVPQFANSDVSKLAKSAKSQHLSINANTPTPRASSDQAISNTAPTTAAFQRRDRSTTGSYLVPPSREASKSADIGAEKQEDSGSMSQLSQDTPKTAIISLDTKSQKHVAITDRLLEAVTEDIKAVQQDIGQRLKKKRQDRPEMQRYNVSARLHATKSSNVQAARGKLYGHQDSPRGRDQSRRQDRRR